MAYLLPDLGILYDYVRHALAETRTRIMLGQFKDPVYYSVRDGVLCKMPDHPPLQNSLLKFQNYLRSRTEDLIGTYFMIGIGYYFSILLCVASFVSPSYQ